MSSRPTAIAWRRPPSAASRCRIRLNDLELKQKSRDKNMKKPPLKVQLRQAGMSVSVQKFYIFSAVCGVACALLVMFLGAPLLVVPGAFLTGMFGFAALVRGLQALRRIKGLPSNELPNALDVLVRSVRSGLPLHDGVRLIANEAPEPVKTGVPPRGPNRRISACPCRRLRFACRKRCPCPEAGFLRHRDPDPKPRPAANLSEALRQPVPRCCATARR